MTNIVTDSGYRAARSRTSFTQAESVSLALSAARWYLPSLSSLTRTVSHLRSPFAIVGRPLARFSIGALCTNK